MHQEQLHNSILLDFDSGVYSLKAVTNASYDFTDNFGIQIESPPSGKILVYLTLKPKVRDNIDLLIIDFKNHVLDHQVRIKVNEDFKVIREMIIAQAFEPCDNLQEIVDALNP